MQSTLHAIQRKELALVVIGHILAMDALLGSALLIYLH